MRLCCALIAILATCQANPVNIATVGKEYIYAFETDVLAGTKEPTDFGSRYQYSGKLHLTGIKDNLVQFAVTDLAYTIDNGAIKPREMPPNTPAPADATPLTLPFQVEYDTTGRLISLRTDPKDMEWSVNMKKAIAVNFEIGPLQTMADGATFAKVVEQTIYGKCDVNYQILAKEAAELRMVKTMDPSSCKNNLRLKEEKDFISTDSGKVYYLMEKDGKMMVKSIKSEGAVIAHPKGVRNQNAFVLVRQFYDFIKEEASSVTVPKEEGTVHKSYKFSDPTDKCRDTPLQSVVDVTGGRHQIDTAVLIKKVDHLLEKIVLYFDENHITMMKPEMKNINLITRILFKLETANLDVLEQIFSVLTEKGETRKLQAYTEILAYIGTRPSAILIRNLIRKNKIEDLKVVERMLFNLPEQIRCPTEKLLVELKDFMDLKTKDRVVNEVAALAFSTLVKYTFENVDEKSAENYIQAFEEKYKAATDYQSRLVYLECLGNIQIGSVLKRTLAMLEDEKDTPLRMMMLGNSITRLYEDPNLMVRTVWPILTNRKIDPRLRLMAHTVYTRWIKTPTVNHFINLYWAMQYEPNELIYSFHYNTIKSLSQPSEFYPNSQALADVCKLIIRISRKPMIKVTAGLIIMENVDKVSGTGIRGEVMSFPDGNGKKTMAFTIHRKFNSEVEEIMSLYSFDQDHKHWFALHKFNRCAKVVLISQGFPKFIRDLLSPISLPLADKKMESIMIPLSSETVIPNDMGAPIKLYDRMSILLQMQFKLDVEDDWCLDLHIKGVQSMVLGMKSYNPFNNLWHGIQELRTMAVDIPFSGKITLEADGFNAVWETGSKDVIGAQFYGETQVFIENLAEKKDRELLGVGDVSGMFVKIERENVKPTTLTVLDESFPEIGKQLKVQVFECDRDISFGKLAKVELEDFQISKLLIFNVFKHKSLVWDTPGIQSCGVGYQLIPMKDIARVDFTGVYSTIDQVEKTGIPDNETYTAMFRTLSPKNESVSMIKLVFSKPAKPWSTIHEGMAIFGEFSNEKSYKVPFYMNVTMVPGDYGIKLSLDLPGDEPLNHFDYSLLAMRSEEQDKTQHILSSKCKPEFYVENQLMPISRKCYLTETGLRKYVFKVDATGPKEKESNSYEFTFPLLRSGVVDIKTFDDYVIEGVPNLFDKYHFHSLTPPVNTYLGFEAFDFVWERHSCIVRPNFIMRGNMMKNWDMVKKDWTLYLSNKQKEERYEIYLKTGAESDSLAFKMVRDKETLECDTVKEGFECKLDGKVLSDPKYTPMKTKIKRMTTANPPIMLADMDRRVMIVYDGKSARIEYTIEMTRKFDEDTEISGICLDDKDTFCWLDLEPEKPSA